MTINILKTNLFDNLKQYNTAIELIPNYCGFNSNYDFAKNIVSPWFDYKNVKNLGLSRTYPAMCDVQYRPEYCLHIHCSNYLPIFLINLLFSDRKDIMIEDIGGGMGWMFLFLNKLGFNNFHLWENFSQVSREIAEKFLTDNKIPCIINKPETKPVITNNVGVPAFVNRELQDNLELICCYTNRSLEKQAEEYLPNNNFSFLCKDSDDLAFIYCRNDKLESFKEKIKPYESR